MSEEERIAFKNLKKYPWKMYHLHSIDLINSALLDEKQIAILNINVIFSYINKKLIWPIFEA